MLKKKLSKDMPLVSSRSLRESSEDLLVLLDGFLMCSREGSNHRVRLDMRKRFFPEWLLGTAQAPQGMVTAPRLQGFEQLSQG